MYPGSQIKGNHSREAEGPRDDVSRGPLQECSGDDLLSHPALADSTIGAVGLNCRVRKGIGCFPYAMVTGKIGEQRLYLRRRTGSNRAPGIRSKKIAQASRLISTTRLNPLPDVHLWPINPVIFREPSVPRRSEGREISSWGGLRAYMPSALIPAEHSYPAMPLMRQLVH